MTLSIRYLLFVGLGALMTSATSAQQSTPVLAQTPPMGWNSYNCYGATVRESEVKTNTDYIAQNLKQYGWQYVVVDFCWFYPHPPKSRQSNPPQYRNQDSSYVPWLPMDNYARLLPDPGKFPSAASGTGFKPLADYVHSKGLKFGIHVMRGIPRQAVWDKTPIEGTNGITADMIADTTSKCPWLNTMYGVNMNKPGAQAYYNSIVNLYAKWGVDFIKIDDIDLNDKYPYYAQEVAAMRAAIDQCNRPIILSLSLNMKHQNKDHIIRNANMFRISHDFWDEWPALKNQFERADLWTDARGPGHWPDNDMLQIGRLSKRGPVGFERDSKFTPDELRTHMTLWAIAQSPLMIGGDLPSSNDYSISLFKNPEVIDVDQHSINAHQLFRDQNQVIWVSKSSDGAYNVGLFNISDSPQVVQFDLRRIGLKNALIRDVWKTINLGSFSNTFAQSINPHGCMLLKVTAGDERTRSSANKTD